MLAVAIALFVGRTAEQPTLPNAILDYQEAITRDAAQSVRRGVNEGVDDLEQFALTLEARDASAAFPADVDLPALLRGVAATHGRYQALYLLRGSGRVIARVGGTPLAALLDPPPPYREPGMHDARRTSGRGVPLLQQYAPIRSGRSDDRLTVVGHYDTRFMRFALEVAQPGDAWVVNPRGQVIGALGSVPRFTTLPGRALRAAAARGSAGRSGAQVIGGSTDSEQVIAYSPLAGPGAAGQYGWAVVTSRTVTSFSLPAADAHRHALLAALVLAMVTVISFGWLYIVLVRPVLRLQAEAERLAHGDLSTGVEIIRYDEIGLIARSLERMRIMLIRRRVKRPQSSDD